MNRKGQKGTELVTCWIPFTKTRIENGCMLAVKSSHKFGLVNHETGSKGQVEIKGKEAIEKNKLTTVPLEADVGDIILLNRYLLHCSLPNKSKNFRISMDLRYNKAGQPSGRDPLPSFIVNSKKKVKSKFKITNSGLLYGKKQKTNVSQENGLTNTLYPLLIIQKEIYLI